MEKIVLRLTPLLRALPHAGRAPGRRVKTHTFIGDYNMTDERMAQLLYLSDAERNLNRWLTRNVDIGWVGAELAQIRQQIAALILNLDWW
jgi:hypothetical protein